MFSIFLINNKINDFKIQSSTYHTFKPYARDILDKFKTKRIGLPLEQNLS